MGMGAAVLALGSAGLVLCQRPGRFRLALVIGATAVGLSQVVPVLHIVAGVVAIETWEFASGANVNVTTGRGLSEVGGFAVTVMTAQPLILAALLFGYAFCWMREWPAPSAVAEGDDPGANV
jgi:hypothetical protein